jgi:hypothetical protein
MEVTVTIRVGVTCCDHITMRKCRDSICLYDTIIAVKISKRLSQKIKQFSKRK